MLYLDDGGNRAHSAVDKFEEALLELVEKKPLNKITVQNILDHGGMSRQTFYRKFRDKQDLVNAIYRDHVATSWTGRGFDIDSYYANVDLGSRILYHEKFLREAFREEGINSIENYIAQYYVGWYERNLIAIGQEVTPQMHMVIQHAAWGTAKMSRYWVEQLRMPKPEQIAEDLMITRPVQLERMYRQKKG